MILHAGQRTDIVQYYTPWLLRRLEAGYLLARNPACQNRVSRYRLDRSVVDCFVLCSKNYEPILPYLRYVDNKLPLLCYMTITAYGRDLEPNVPDKEDAVMILRELSSILGKHRVIWRYDPVFLTQKYTLDCHLNIFDKLCAYLAPYVDHCDFAFLHDFPLRENHPELRRLVFEEEDMVAEGLASIARSYGLSLRCCAARQDFSRYGILPAGCLTERTLERALGREIPSLPKKGLRANCLCVESRDIGAYDCCPNGCAYCYATRSPELVKRNYAMHDPDSPLLIGNVESEDLVADAVQKSIFRLSRGIPMERLPIPFPERR